MLDLTKFEETSRAVPDREPMDVFYHLVEEVGEVATAIHRPEKITEPLVGELADVINCLLDIGMRAHGRVMELPEASTYCRDLDHAFIELVEVQGAIGLALMCDEPEVELHIENALYFVFSIYSKLYGTDYTLLQEHLDRKCDKWRAQTL